MLHTCTNNKTKLPNGENTSFSSLNIVSDIEENVLITLNSVRKVS